MAQYTPNFNLYEPDSSDDFADFRTEFNNNMNIIDQNLGGGGGSGGHTIYDKDGNALAQESGLQFTGNVNVSDDSGNGRTVVDILGGGGNVYGAFLDPSRVIYSAFTFDSSTHSWTATEDCILTDNMTPPDGSTAYFIRIDGKQVFAGYNTVEDPFVYVKKGQVVEYRAKSGSTMKAYGLTQGTNGIFAPVIYSDNERVIGVWRDNKPLYQKTCIFNPPFSAGNNTFNLNLSSECVIKTYSLFMHDNVSSPITIGQGDELKMINIGYNSGVNRAVVWIASGTLPYLNNGQIWITVQYTKTTDVAGSGNWNTDGVPTHHYSTSEQVVGTWINNKPLYEKTVELTSLEYDTNWHDRTHGIADIATIVDVKAVCTTSDGYFYPVPTPRANTTLGFTLEFTATKVSYLNNWVSQPDKLYVTIQYTKTTD